jgi:hypothetical protein
MYSDREWAWAELRLVKFTSAEWAAMMAPSPKKEAKKEGQSKGKRPRTDRQGAQPSASA